LQIIKFSAMQSISS